MNDEKWNSEYAPGASGATGTEPPPRMRVDDDEDQASLADMIRWAGNVVRKRRWWILTTFFLVAIGGAAVIALMPNKYQSEATLVLVRPRIPERFVERLNVVSAEEELSTLQREILSRKRLVEIVDAVGLYREQRDQMTHDALAERFRRDIIVEPASVLPHGGIGAFRVAYTGTDPNLSHDVVSRVASLFIEENIRTQDVSQSTTARFLTQNLEAAKRRLMEQENRLREFKLQNLGQLPEQQQIALTGLTELRSELQANNIRLSKARQQQIDLESAIQGYIARAESEKATLLARFTARHPEVVKKERDVEQAKALLTLLKTGVRQPERLQAGTGPDDPWIAQIRGQIEANAQEMAITTSQEERLQAQMAQYQTRINLSPVREQQLTELMRDYESYKNDYNDLLSKQLRYQQTETLDDQQQGDYYRMIDPPTVPTKSSGPKRRELCLGAIILGLGLGLVLGALVETIHPTFREEQEIKKEFGVPLVVGIPLALKPNEVQSRRIRMIFETFAGSAMLIVVAVAVLYAARNA